MTLHQRELIRSVVTIRGDAMILYLLQRQRMPMSAELMVLSLRFPETTLPLRTVPVTTVLNNLWPQSTASQTSSGDNIATSDRAGGPLSEVSGDNIATSDSARNNGTQQPLASAPTAKKFFFFLARFSGDNIATPDRAGGLLSEVSGDNIPLQTAPVTTVDSARNNGTQQPLTSTSTATDRAVSSATSSATGHTA